MGIQGHGNGTGGGDGFSTYGAASASARSAMEYSEPEEEENRFVGFRGNETETEMDQRRLLLRSSAREASGSGSRNVTPIPPGIERK